MRAIALLPVLMLAACGGNNDTSLFGSGNGNGDGNGPPDPGVVNNVPDGAAFHNDGGTVPQCSEAAKLIYVIDDQGVLHSFYPPTLTFTTIGPVSCPGANGTNSMAIDRSATAWISDNSGALFAASTQDASCKATSFKTGQNGWRKFGMGFSTDSANGVAETLYVSEASGVFGKNDSKGVGKIDLSTFTLIPIGQFDGALGGYAAELTGTGDAHLYGFFTNVPASVAEIDKATAHIMSDAPQQTVNTGTDWAFSFWAGDFYMYTADLHHPGDTTNVTRYRPSDGTTTVVLQQVGFRVVGAGVSTCAPTSPLK
jgi:hypothetical protein